MPGGLLPEIPVHFVYLARDGEEDADTEFDAICVSVPRIGETVVPSAGSQMVRVHNVYHKFVRNDLMDEERFVQYITVVLTEFET